MRISSLAITNKLLALINLKQGDETGPSVRELVYPSAWERL